MGGPPLPNLFVSRFSFFLVGGGGFSSLFVLLDRSSVLVVFFVAAVKPLYNPFVCLKSPTVPSLAQPLKLPRPWSVAVAVEQETSIFCSVKEPG